MSVSPRLVHDLLRASAAHFPERTALIAGDRPITFTELDRTSDALARDLQLAGVGHGDRVALVLDNSIDLVTGMFGVLKCGGAMVVIHPGTKAEKLGFILADCGVSSVIAQPSCGPALGSAAALAQGVRRWYWTGAAPGSAPAGPCLADVAALGGEPRAVPLTGDDLASIIYTSGTTGVPKGVMHTHGSMTSAACSIAAYLGNVPEDVVACILPLSFGYGMFQVMVGALVGYTVVLEKSFTYPFDVLRRLAAHGVTGLPAVPTMFSRLVELGSFGQGALRSLRYLTNAAAALAPALVTRVLERFPSARFHSMYGLTESIRVCSLDPARVRVKSASVGRAIPGTEAYVVDSEGRRVRPGVVGELVVRGPHVMRGYWGRPEETARRLRAGERPGDRVLFTGDQFTMDEEGDLYYYGRSDDVFKCRGEKVSPKEIEHVLHALPGVAEAAVVGVDDPTDGKAILAIVVAREGSTITEQQVRRHCREHLEPHLQPKFVEFRGSLPMTDSGKIRRSELTGGAGGTTP